MRIETTVAAQQRLRLSGMDRRNQNISDTNRRYNIEYRIAILLYFVLRFSINNNDLLRIFISSNKSTGDTIYVMKLFVCTYAMYLSNLFTLITYFLFHFFFSYNFNRQ